MTKETKTQATFERSAAIFMAFVCAISLLAGAGWLFNRTILASLRSEYIPMAPANVLIFLGLCGVWLIHTYFSAQRGIRILIQVTLLGKLIVVIILALRYFTGLGPDLEKLLYPAPPLFGQFTTARMSPLSALGFLLAIPAFLFLTGSKPGPRTNRASAALALALFILSSLIVIGYLYGTPPFYGGTLTPVAITSAFSFLFLSLGLLLMAGPDRWPVRMYVGPSLRARLMRAFIPASVFIALFQGLFSTANDPWIVNPAIKVVVAALVACLIVLLLVFLIANNLSSDIERGRMAEEALTRSEAKLHALFAGMTDVVIVYDTDGRYIEIAPTNPANFTHSPEEMLGKTIHEILPKEPADAILAMIRTSIQSGQVANCEYDLQIDGKEIYFAASASRLSETTAIMVAHDITNRKRAEQLLREIEERYRTLIEASTDMIFVIDRADRVQYINTFSARQFGMTPEQVIGKPRTDLFPPDIADQQGQSLRSVFASGQPVANDARLRFGEREVWISSSLVPLRDESGAVIAVMGISRDITEHKQVEQALKRAERKYRNIFENAMEGIHQTTYDGKIISVNLAGARILGFDSPEELMTSANFLNTRFYVQPGRREEFQRLIETKEALSGFESEIYRKDGSTAWISENAHAVRDEHGNLLYNEGTSVDITERKRAEEALATSEAKLHALFAGMTDVVIIYDIDGRYLEIAPTNPANLYRPPEEMLGKTLHEILPKEPADAILTMIRSSIQNGQIVNGEYTLQINGKEIYFAASASRLSETTAIMVAHDITNRKRMEENIRSLSLTDELTGLYNRRGFTMLAEQEVKLAQRNKRSLLLFFGDLDGLKTINDTHGHAQGDLALQEVSAVLKETFREADILARIGGDEFVALTMDASMERVEIMTNRLQSILEKRNQQGDWPYQLSLSLGVAHYDPEAPCTLSELIAQADGRMYQQKQEKKGIK